MNKKTKQVLYWTPRVLAILYIVYIMQFLNVFNEEYSIGITILAFCSNLIPIFIVVLFLAIAWWSGLLGGILFINAGVFSLVITGGEVWIISTLLLLIGALFLIDWIDERRTLEAYKKTK